MGELTRWSVQVSRETDSSLRSYLAEHGGRKDDLSKFIEQAVRTELLRATMREVQGVLLLAQQSALRLDQRNPATSA